MVGAGYALIVFMVPTAIAAAFVGWRALRVTPPNWITLAWAYAILLSPFALSTFGDRDRSEGFMLAVDVAGFTVITPLVGVAVTAGVVYKRERAKYVVDRYSAVVTMHPLADRAVFKDLHRRLVREAGGSGQEQGSTAALKAFNHKVALAESSAALGDLTPALAAEAAQLGVEAIEAADRDQSLGILFWVTAFGTKAERDAVARGWVARRWDQGESASRIALGNGVAALVLGDHERARSQLTAATKETRLTLAAVTHAGLALIDQDWPFFDRHILGSLHEYRDDYRKLPENPAGVMNVFALAMSRLAIEAGATVEERPYLPIRLLPQPI